MNPEISVIICTHNPRKDYFNRVLDALRVQSMPFENWELLVVDNASASPLSGLFDFSWHSSSRVIIEPELGVTQARLRGIQESRGDLIVFVDDDNVLESNYLEIAAKMAVEWSKLGAWSGRVIPEFELEPSPELRPHLWRICIREISIDKWGNTGQFDTLPWGAGMCIRRKIALHYFEQSFANACHKKFSREGKNFLASGEDIAMAFVALDMGFGTGVFQQLKLTHLIPENRVSKKYLIKLIEDSEAGSMALEHARGKQDSSKTVSGIDKIVRFYKFLRANELQRDIERAVCRGRQKGQQTLEALTTKCTK